MRYWTADFRGRLVLPQPLVDHLSQQVIVCPTEIPDLDNKLGWHPMNPAENEGRPETAGSGGKSSGMSGVASSCAIVEAYPRVVVNPTPSVLLDHTANDSTIEIVVVFYNAEDEIAIVKSDLIKAVHTAFDAVLAKQEPNAEQRGYGTRDNGSVSAPRSA